MKNFSKNKKLNAVLNEIRNQLLEVGINEVKRYVDTFKGLPDYNIAQYGNVLVYYDDVRKLYEDCGYISIKKMSDSKLWEVYKKQVGYVALWMLVFDI